MAADRRFVAATLAAVVLIPAVLGSSATIFNDGDVSWHIAAGQWILDQRAIPQTDPFSLTWGGKPWVSFEWGAQLIIGAAYRLAGYGGVAALVTAALAALHAIVFFNAARFVGAWLAVAACVAMDFVLIPMMLARPHLLAWVLIAAWTWLMLRARERDRAPPLAAALAMILWTNLHGSFVMGLAISGAFGLEALVVSDDRARVVRQWGLFGLACAAAVLVNANGLAGVLHPLLVANLATLPLIDEWKPSSPVVTPIFFVVLANVAIVIWLTRPRLHPVRWLMMAGLLALAMWQVRHQAVLAIVAALILPTGFAARRAEAPLRPGFRVALIAGVLLLVAVRALLPVRLPENESNPWALIAAIPPDLQSQPVLNGYSMGGPLILSGIRPYIDGRSDMYGDALVADYKRIADGNPAALDRAVRRWGIRWAILPHRYKRLVSLLERSPGWRRIHQDEVGAIFVRT